jgi:hypothetical protein
LGFDKKITRRHVSFLLQRSAAVSKTSRSIFNVLRLTLRAQPRSENYQRPSLLAY